MENFKKALKLAITEKADAVRFEEGKQPSIVLFVNEKPIAQLPVSDANEVQTLIDNLINNGEPVGPRGREGTLSIVNFGELKLLAQTVSPVRLFAFIPPQGLQLYQQTRNQILGEENREAPRPIDIAGSIAPPPSAMFAMGKTTIPEAAPELPFEAALMPPKAPIAMPALEPEEPLAPAFAEAKPGNFNPDLSVPPFMPMPGLDPANPFAQALEDSKVDSPFAPAESGHAVAKPFIPPVEDDDLSPQKTQLSPRKQEFSPIPSEVSLVGMQESQLSMMGGMPQSSMNELDEDYHYQASSSQIRPLPQAEVKPIIHFGSIIPGESIERTGEFPIDSVLREMVAKKASDLHLTMGEPMCLRIDGDIVRMQGDVLREGRMRELLLPIMPPKNQDEFAKIHDTDFAYEVPGLARFRVNIFRDRMGVGAVLRQIPDKVLSADDLGLPPAVRKFCELHKGLVVVTGPTGSGKSTTLAGMVDLINESRTDHILTIEDPIEFVHRQKKCLINQREVHKHTGSFARALRAALREDPDIILIGEMRDLETVEIAIETAETGHLVFGTLHTNTAISTVDRLIDQFPSDQQEQIRVMLSESLKGVVSQTLVKKKGGGRAAAQEILVVDKAVASLIREGNTHMVQNHMQTQKAKGNITLNDALFNLVSKGIIDPKDGYAKAIEKEAFAALLAGKGIQIEGLPKSA